MTDFKDPWFVVVGILIFFEISSLITALVLQISLWVYPWSIINAVVNQNFVPAATGFLVTVWVLITGYCFYQKGFWCSVGAVLFMFGTIVFIFSSASLIVFNVWGQYRFPIFPWDFYSAFQLTVPYPYLHQTLKSIFIKTYLFGFLGIGLLSVLFMKDKHKKLLGKARFANPLEIQMAKLWGNDGIIIGKLNGKYLRVPGYEGILINAPTGSGKTASIAIPNLLTWSGSCLINDLKGELYLKTQLYRKKYFNQVCLEFAPTRDDKKTAHYNPFFYVRRSSEFKIRDLQIIAEILISCERQEASFWSSSSRQLFILLALYLFETEGMPTLKKIHDLAKQGSFFSWLESEIQKEAIKEPLFYQNAHAILDADDERTRSNILADFHARMALFADPLVGAATAKNDFDLRDLRRHKMSVYVHIPNSDKIRLRPVITLLWAQFIDVLTQEEPILEKEPYGILALLDEFGNMGKIEQLKDGMTFFRSYRIRPVVITQYLGQIREVYGQEGAKAFLNAKARVLYGLTDMDDAKFFSGALGQKTVKLKTLGGSHGMEGNSSWNTQYQSRPLVSSDELTKLPEKTCIILLEGMHPVKAKKCYWFKEKAFKKALSEWGSVQ